MKRFGRFILLLIIMASLAVSCGKESESIEEIPNTTEQVVEDVVVDYTALSTNELEVLAYEGDPKAMYQLAVVYEYGTETTSQNFDKAFEWYEKAAQRENAEAVCAIGYFYLNAVGREQSIEAAKIYFSQAIELGNINAKVGLARCYLEEYMASDEYEMLLAERKLAEEAEVDGDVASSEADKDETINLQEDQADEESADGQEPEKSETEKKLEEMFTLIMTASSAGDLDAIYYYGYLHELGIQTEYSFDKAALKYNQVIASESTDIRYKFAKDSANLRMGLMYMNGCFDEDAVEEIEDEPEDKAKKDLEALEKNDQETALNYFMAAADDGFPQAQYYVGQIYENGLGVGRDYEKALEFYMAAADEEFAPALNQIGYMYFNGYGVDVNFATAAYYQKLAALQGYTPAQANLGFLYEYGYGVERNLKTACSYYELAADAGFEGAQEAIVRVKAQMNE